MKIRKEFLPFSRPSIGKDEINKVTTCLKSGGLRQERFVKNLKIISVSSRVHNRRYL